MKKICFSIYLIIIFILILGCPKKIQNNDNKENSHNKPASSNNEILTCKTPESAISSFCDLWSKGKFDNMYELLSTERKSSTELKYFISSMQKDSVNTGLPKSYRIIKKDSDLNSKSLWTIKIEFKNKRVGKLMKKTWVIDEGERGWKIDQGGLGPLFTNVFQNQ